MLNLKNVLELKKKSDAKRPAFNRQERFQRKENKGSWRKPKGLHSKMRHRFQGHGALVEIGYRCPKAVRGFTKEGLAIKLILNANNMESLDSQKDTVIIGKMGSKKKAEILKLLLEKNIKILNISDAKDWLKSAEQKIAERKEKKKTFVKKEEKKADKKEEKASESKKEEKTEEEKKKELDKLLIKKEA